MAGPVEIGRSIQNPLELGAGPAAAGGPANQLEGLALLAQRRKATATCECVRTLLPTRKDGTNASRMASVEDDT